MRNAFLSIAACTALLAACSTPTEREWMKVSERYTVADFRRDYAECSRGGTLDESCMRNRGWVPVSAGKAEKTPQREPELRPTPGGRY
jgi:hypothetical protein